MANVCIADIDVCHGRMCYERFRISNTGSPTYLHLPPTETVECES